MQEPSSLAKLSKARQAEIVKPPQGNTYSAARSATTLRDRAKVLRSAASAAQMSRNGLVLASSIGMSVDTAVLPQSTRDADTDRRPRSIALSTPTAGMLWFGGWLFTIGFAQLGLWKALLALVIWPYFLGVLAR